MALTQEADYSNLPLQDTGRLHGGVCGEVWDPCGEAQQTAERNRA